MQSRGQSEKPSSVPRAGLFVQPFCFRISIPCRIKIVRSITHFPSRYIPFYTRTSRLKYYNVYIVIQISCIIVMPSGARRCIIIVSTHVILWARAPGMLSRPAEGSCFCLATVYFLSVPALPKCKRLLSPSLSRQRARRYRSTLPSDCCCLSSR